MPYAPNKPCTHPGCPALIPPSERRCSTHKKAENREYNTQKRSKRDAFYHTQKWRAYRKRILEERGKGCVSCGRVAISPHLDHVQPIELRPDLAFNDHNIQVLCHTCHNRKTAKE